MRFQVPQFIEMEDRIFFGLSFRQFLYLVGGAAICFVILRFVPLFVGILLCVPVVALAFALTFKQVNNKPFIFFMENAFMYFFSKKLYIWSKDRTPSPQAKQQTESIPLSDMDPLLNIPKMANSKLKDLSYKIDTHKELPVTNQ